MSDSYTSDDELQSSAVPVSTSGVSAAAAAYRHALLSQAQHSVQNSDDEEYADVTDEQIELGHADTQLQQIRSTEHNLSPPHNGTDVVHACSTHSTAHQQHVHHTLEQDIDLNHSDVDGDVLYAVENLDDGACGSVSYELSGYAAADAFDGAERVDDMVDSAQFGSPTRVLAEEALLMEPTSISSVEQSHHTDTMQDSSKNALLDTVGNDTVDSQHHTHMSVTPSKHTLNAYCELAQQFDSPSAMFASRSRPLGTLGLAGTQRPTFYSPTDNHDNDASHTDSSDVIAAHDIVSPVRTHTVQLLSSSVDVTDDMQTAAAEITDTSYNIQSTKQSVPATPTQPAVQNHTHSMQTPPFLVATQCTADMEHKHNPGATHDASSHITNLHTVADSALSDDGALPQCSDSMLSSDVGADRLLDSHWSYQSHLGLTAAVDSELAHINHHANTQNNAITDITNQHNKRPLAHTSESSKPPPVGSVHLAQTFNKSIGVSANRCITSAQLRKIHRFIHFQMDQHATQQLNSHDVPAHVQWLVDDYVQRYGESTQLHPVYQSVKQTGTRPVPPAYTVMLIYDVPADGDTQSDWQAMFTDLTKQHVLNTQFIELKPHRTAH